MKKVNIKYINTYPKKEIYFLAHELGTQLINYLEEDLFFLLLDSEILTNYYDKKYYCISDNTYKLHPAAKALEGFLEKLIKRKKLKENHSDKIGDVFGLKQSIVRKKINDSRLIAKTKSTWDFCRNDIMHYDGKESIDVHKLNKEIREIIKELFVDFYGKSIPDEDVQKGHNFEVLKFMKKHDPECYRIMKDIKKNKS